MKRANECASQAGSRRWAATCSAARPTARLDWHTQTPRKTFTVEKGATVNLDTVANLLQPAYYRSQYTSTTQGLSLTSVLRPWQHAPPAHGSTTTLYQQDVQVDADSGPIGAVARTWIDDATKFPVREELTAPSSGTLIQATYYDYDKQRLTTRDVPADSGGKLASAARMGRERTRLTGGSLQACRQLSAPR